MLIITTYPWLLTPDAESSLLLKLTVQRRYSNSELTDFVSIVPKILGKRVAKSTGLYTVKKVEFLGGEDELVTKGRGCEV